MAEIIPLNGNSVLNHGETCPLVIDKLEELLAAARSGMLRALAYAMISNERGIVLGWEGHCDRHDMIAGVAMLQHDLMATAMDSRTET